MKNSFFKFIHQKTKTDNNVYKIEKDEVVAFIEKDLCGFFGDLNATCVQYIEAYGKMLLYYLGQQVDPSTICHNTLHLCSTKKTQIFNLKGNFFYLPLTKAH